MKKFISIENAETGLSVLVNPDHIVKIEPRGEEMCAISLAYMNCTETLITNVSLCSLRLTINSAYR